MHPLDTYTGYLNSEERNELRMYINIFLENNYSEHYEVNIYITRNSMWDQFPTIRSLNDHGHDYDIEGILPKYYGIVCKALEITDAGGKPLDRARSY